MIKHGRSFLTVTLLTGLLAAPQTGQSAPEGKPKSAAQGKPRIEPEAEKMLRQMTDYLASLTSFKVQVSSIDEAVTKAGQKIQFASESQVMVERPNRLRSQQMGAANGLAFWYDGKTMTVACPASNTFATAPAPATVDATIDAARKKFKIDAPGADLLYSKPYEILTEQVTTGRFIGKETIGEVPVHHLAFTGEDVDWQIWIQEGAQPLPLRFVITTKTMKSQPAFTVQMSNWEPKADLDDSTFQFKAPAGATRVDAFPQACAIVR
jgi:hypothetical protein